VAEPANPRAVPAERATVGGPAPGDAPVEAAPVAGPPTRRRGLPIPPPVAFEPKPRWQAAIYIFASTLIYWTQGLGLNLVTANLAQIQGPLGATTNETAWLAAAYLAPNVSLTLLLTKVRAQYGLRRFGRLAILLYVLVMGLHLTVDDLSSAVAVRFFAGVAASPMSSLAFLYMLESFPPERKMTIGVSLGMTNIALAPVIARLVSPPLLDLGDWDALFLFETAMAMMSFGFIYLLPLRSPPKTPVIEPMDVVSYLLVAVGLGSLAVAATMGPFEWWFEARWIGVVIALGLLCLTLFVATELNRANPLVDIRWITSREILHFAGTLLLFRLILSEQTSGATGFFQALGLRNEQMTVLNLLMFASGLGAGLVCAAILKPGRAPAIHAVALALLAGGAFLDSQATSLTRPEQMYLSQSMIAAAGTLFLPPAMATGFTSAMRRGMNYILSFLIVFLTTQSLGGAIGSAAFRTFVTMREKFHSSQIAENVVLSDPIVAARIAALGNSYRATLGDAALRQAEGLALLGTQATREATTLAYADAFFAIGCLSSAGLAALLLHVLYRRLRGRPAAEPPAAAAPVATATAR